MGILKDTINALYKISRSSGKAASNLNTVKTVLSGDPEKIVKHIARKQVYKSGNKITKKISSKIK